MATHVAYQFGEEPPPEDGRASSGRSTGWPAMTAYNNGGALPAGAVTCLNDTGKPIPVFTVKQIEGFRAWLRDHYRDGTFRCPSGGSETGGNPGGTEGGGGSPGPDNRDG